MLAQPVTALLGGYREEKLALATVLMTILGICILFNAIVLLTNAIMQAHGHVNIPVVNMFVGGIVKLVAVYILTGNPAIGIAGTPIGTLLCYLCITTLNLITMRKVLPQAPAILKNMLRPLLCAALMGAVAYGTWYGMTNVLDITNRVLTCAAPIGLGALVYIFTAVKLRAITREDCLLLPKGEKIANLLKL